MMMKLISLNVWHGKEFDALSAFLRNPKNSADVYCFQEVTSNKEGIVVDSNIRANFLEDLRKIFPGFKIYYYPFLFDKLHFFDELGDKLTEHVLELGTAILVRESGSIRRRLYVDLSG